MLNNIKNFFKGHERTVKAKKNILWSFLIKGVSIISGFLMVRVTLNYLDQTSYGIWLTLSSFLTWFVFFEIGLGNGLKNKLSEALAKKDYDLARIYVSTTYAIITIVISVVAISFFIGNFFIDWTIVLNTDKAMSTELTTLSFIVFGFFFLRFVLQLIDNVIRADQRPAVANAFGPIGNVISLIIIYILTLTTKGSLLYLGWVLSLSPTIVLIIASIYFYGKRYSFLVPSIKYVDFNYARDLLGLGFKFFVIKISMLVMYQTSLIIIAQAFGPDEVVVYNVGYKYFSIIIMVFAIIVGPFWAAFTEAWIREEIDWIRKTVTKLFYVWIASSVLGIFMLIFSNSFYEFWIGDKVKIPFNISFLFLIYFITKNFGDVFKMFVNGVGYIKLQMFSSILSIIIFILSSVIMILHLKMGIESIIIAMIISDVYGIFIAPIQYKKIITNKAVGIWKM